MAVRLFTDAFPAKTADDVTPTANLELRSRFHIDDQQIRALGSLLEEETRAGCPNGRVHGESLGMALALYVLRNYTSGLRKMAVYAGGLAKYQLRQVVDYIVAHLTEDSSLQQLADVAGLSSFHFCRLFKQSTGLSPHRYLLKLRIEESKRLLRNTRLGIAEIASCVGFSDQSHFSMSFRKRVGTTPTDWRRSC
jgi:AraC family transcriptional regulator